MDRICSIEDLQKARTDAMNEASVTIQQRPFEVRVSLGSCGVAADASETLDSIHQFIRDNHIQGVQTTVIGCLGLCALEPIVQVLEVNRPTITYGKVVPAVVQRIFKEHIAKHIPVQEYIVENI
jgi:NADP-reducing hydrogenase subunit HndB